MKYVAYYRVSTLKQSSNHSLEAQRNEVHKAIGTENILKEFTDVESGSHTNRKELQKAIKLCKETNSTLIAFRLDRLTRNLKTIIELQDKEIKYTALDCLNDSQMIIEIKTSINQDFLRQLSDKTKSGLKVARAKGKKIGSPQNLTSSARAKGVQANKENSKLNENNKKAFELIQLLRDKNISFNKIAQKLNASGFKTAKGKEFQAVQVQRIYNKYTA